MDNLAYIDDTVLKQKTELINGVIYLVSPRPSIDHLSVVGNIYRHFANYLSGKNASLFLTALMSTSMNRTVSYLTE